MKAQFIVTIEGTWLDSGRRVTAQMIERDLREAVKSEFGFLAKKVTVKRHAVQVAEPTLEQEHEEGAALFLASAPVAPVDVLWAEPVAEPAPSGASVDSVARGLYCYPECSPTFQALDARDAARYRWLRHADLDALARENWGVGDVYEGEHFDAAIDAAMSPTKAGEE